MPKIENVGLGDIKIGHHNYWGDNCVLIRILSDGDPFDLVTPSRYFSETHLFNFDDIESEEKNCVLCTQEDAERILDILQSALDQNKNVVVHCAAGVCRSGAVVEVAELIGFDKCSKFRLPNLHVKKLLIAEALRRNWIH